MGKVWYIPDQVNGIGTSPPAARNNPLHLIWRDIRTLVPLIGLLPKLFVPFCTTEEEDELYIQRPNIWYILQLVAITFFEILILPPTISAALTAPGCVGLFIILAVLGSVWAMCAPIQGPTVIHSAVPENNSSQAPGRPDERWIFVNGILVTGYGLEQNCKRLARTFGRPITGIHNPTYGLIGDLIECIVQRSFSYNTRDIRMTYDYVRDVLLDTTVDKAVLIGHSQGGIVISMVLDMLFASLAGKDVAKIEVYTFGSAASHFNNPQRQTSSSAPYSGLIKHIEHYVNGEDLVPRWGVLYNKSVPHNRYAGKIFIRVGASGHMLNQHYLSRMFPSANKRQEEHPSFLDQIVSSIKVETPDDGEITYASERSYSQMPLSPMTRRYHRCASESPESP